MNEPDNGTYVPEKSTRKSSAKKSESFKKRKNSESESDSEDEENSDNESKGELNGQAKHRKISGGKATGEGRGPNTGGKGSSKRGRPRKS